MFRNDFKKYIETRINYFKVGFDSKKKRADKYTYSLFIRCIVEFSSNLGELMIASGIFQGWIVNQLLVEANSFIGGCGSSYSAAELNSALDSINNNFDNGTIAGSFLVCN